MQPIQTMRLGVGGKPSAKTRDSLSRPIAEPSEMRVVRNAAGEALSNDGAKRYETRVGSSKLPDAS